MRPKFETVKIQGGNPRKGENFNIILFTKTFLLNERQSNVAT